MSIQKQIVLIGMVVILLVSALFLYVRQEYNTKYSVTTKEIEGIEKITNIHKLDILIKNIRGISQLDTNEATLLKKKLFISNSKILEAIKKVDDKSIQNDYLEIIEKAKKYSKERIFDKYTKLLTKLYYKRVDIADDSYLLLEYNREIYFLISTVVLNIPKTIENIGKIRGVGTSILRSKINLKEKEFLLKSNVLMFLKNVEDIKYMISKLPSNYSDELNVKIDFILTDFYELDINIKKILDNSLSLEPREYFLKTSKSLNNINNLFIISKNILKEKLEQRIVDLEMKLSLGIIFYILIISAILLFIFVIYKAKNREIQILEKRKKEDQFVASLQNNYFEDKTLKKICNKSLKHMINYFKAINGSLYLYDRDNEKLYLGATYAIEYESLKHTLNLHENIISENIIEKKINIMDINKKINIGNINMYVSKIVTIPLLEFDYSIGTIQLIFDDKFNKIDIDFLQYITTFMASYISNALKDDEVNRYLNLIDKNVLISQTDLDGNITKVSEEFCKLSKYTKDELLGENHRILKHEDMNDDFFVDMWADIKKGISWRGEVKNKTKDGGYYWVDSLITPDSDINGNIIGYTAIRTDITDKKKIEEIAITDGLTSLYNRRHFDTIFPQQIEINKRARGLLTFALIDIDHFKQYNDNYGHQEGDVVLKKVALVLKNTLQRAGDYTFRLGGEEFGMLYSIKNEEDAITIANKARRNVQELKIEHIGNSASKYISISIGVYVISADDTNNSNKIYKNCDKALYIAKHNGRNQVHKI